MNKFQIELQPHNGCAGRNRIQPFDGAIIDLPKHLGDFDYETAARTVVDHEGRTFRYAYPVEFDTNCFYVFRELVQTAPSQWAMKRQAEQVR
jgi:hypothetical protein